MILNGNNRRRIVKINQYGIYTDVEILDQEFIETFHGNKNDLEKNLKRILDKFLRQQAGMEDSESSGNKSDDEESDGSEKIGEILSPEEYESWDENIGDFEENEPENEFENIINTGGL